MLFVAMDAKGVISALDHLAEGTNRAVVRALNRAIKSARTVETREIAGDTGLKQKDVREALTLRTANGGTAAASLSAPLKRIPLIKFGAKGPRPSRGKGSGVTYRLQGGRDRLPSAFIATMASGHEGVFTRTSKGRLPIGERFGPSLGHVFIKYKPEAIARAEESFLASFGHEMTFGGPPVPQGLEASDAGS